MQAPGADSDVTTTAKGAKSHSCDRVPLWLFAPFAVVYGIVLECMAYCAFADPGQVKTTRNMKICAVGGMDVEEGMPRGAHKSW